MKTPFPSCLTRCLTHRSFRSAILTLVFFPLAVLPQGYALPTGGQVAAGNASIAQSGAQMTITQTSRNAIVNWQSFSVGAAEQLRLSQSGADAAMLARVTGNDPSALLGSIQANGKLFLINQHGILVGQGAVIDTAAFIGSTRDVSDADFLRGAAMTFRGDSDAGIVNLGQITAHEGNVLLFAHTVQNAGTISAPKGTAGLGAGNEVYLASPDDAAFVIKFNLPHTTAKTGVENTGVIEAAQAQLQAAGGSIYDLAINQSGIIRATGTAIRNGRVLLTADGGTVGISGSTTARNADGSGGEILAGGDLHGANPDVPNATYTAVTANATLDASATSATGAGGRVVVWSDQATRFLGTINAQGGASAPEASGGFAEVSGKHGLDFNPAAPVNLGTGGTLLLDPDALVVSSGTSANTTTSGSNPFTFGASTTPATLNVTTLQNQLASSNVILDTSGSAGDITFSAPVAWSSANSLTAAAGGSININQSITASNPASALVLEPGKAATPTQQGFDPINPRATLASSASITAGTLTYGTNGNAAPAGYSLTGHGAASADFEGNLNVGTLQVDLSNGGTGVGTFGANNTIGTFKTTGTGDLTFANISNNHGNLNVLLNSSNASASQVTVTTPGTLTLLAGTSLNFTRQTDVVLASSGGAFVNQAGATPFGANARYLIYTSTPAATTRGGLTPTYVFNQSFDANNDLASFGSDTISRLIYSGSKATVTFTADNQSRVYGDNNATPTATPTGLVDGDTLATSGLTGAPALADTATKASGVGSYAITAANGTLAASSFYNFAVAPGSLSITPAPLTVAVDSLARTYGDANPTLTANFSGLKNSDTAASVATLALSTTAATSSNVGAYPITGSLTGVSANYTASVTPGTLTVNQAPLTVTVSNSITKAQGAANPDFTAFTSASGLKLSDTLTTAVPNLSYITAATATSPDGPYAVTPTGTSTNYALTFNPGLLTISTVILPTLTYHAQDATRTYGDANPTFGFTRTGLVMGTADDVTGAPVFSTTATQNSGVGSYVIDIAKGTLASSNYQFSFVPGSLSITAAPLAIAINSASRIYGDSDPAFTSSISGLKNSDVAQAVGSLTYSSTAGAASGVGNYPINATFAGANSNYTATITPGTLSVTPATLTATINNASRAPNTANPAFSATYSGFKNTDTASVISGLSFATTATLSSPSGSYPITGSGTATNYTLNFIPGSLTIGGTLNYAATSFSRVYGDANPSSLPFSVTGLLSGDTLANVATGAPALSTTATQSSGVGGYTISIARGTLASPSYGFSFTPGTLSVTAAPLTITADNVSRALDHANPALTASYSGFKNGDTSSVVSGLQLSTTATIASPTGTYPITGSGASAANYSITYIPGTLTIGSLGLLTISANNLSRTYGAANPAFTASYSGLTSGDTASVVSGLQFSTTANLASGVGTYTITPFGASAPGYSIGYLSGTLAVTPASLFISPQNANRAYGDANPAFTANYSGLVNGDTASVVSGLTFATTATTASGVGVYPLTVSGGTAANYTITTGGSAQLKIDPALLTVKFNDQTRAYGDANPALTYTISGLKNGDTAANSVSVLNISSNAAPTDGIGAYGINGLALSQSSNYNAVSVGGSLTITPRPLTITADDKTKVYGDANPALTATFTGLASFDTSAAIPNLKLTTTATQASGVSPLGYGILVTSDLNRNYTIGYKFGTLTINPASLSLLAPPDVSRLYGRADPTLPALNFGGLKNSDTIAGLSASYVNLPAPTADAGTYTYGVAINNPNYKLTGATTGTFRVDPAPLDVLIDGAGRTYGDANPASYGFSANGLAFGQTAASVLQVTNPTDQTTGVGIYSLKAITTSKNYYINSTTGGNFQINPRLLTFSIDNVARYYGDVDPLFTYTLGAGGLAPSDNITAIISGFKTAVSVGVTTDVGLYRIDPIVKTNPNYLVSWTPGYLAIVPRPIALTVNNAVAFGNDDVPDDFSVAGTGIDLVHPTGGGGSGFTGFTVTATNLPANVLLGTVYPSLSFKLSSTNDPVPVATATDLSTVFTGVPHTATPAQAATTTATADPSAATVIPLPAGTTVSTTLAVDPTVYAIINGQVVKNPSAAQAVLDKFADQISYITPTLYSNSNYAVTKITAGTLTFKVDPAIVRVNVEVALQEDQRAAAEKEFENGGQTGAFGLPPDMFSLLREVLGKMLNDALASGDTGPGSLYYEVNGSSSDIFTGDQTQEDKFLFWLADIHTNVAKQAELLPGLLTYAINVAGRDPSTWTDADKELVNYMTPYVQKAQEQFAQQITTEKAAWLKAQDSAAGAASFIMGTGDMYTDVVTAAVLDVSKSATDKLSATVTKMVNDANSSLATLDPAYGQITTTLKYSADTALSGAGLAASVAATKAYLAATNSINSSNAANKLYGEPEYDAEGKLIGRKENGMRADFNKLFTNDKNLNDALQKITDDATGNTGTGDDAVTRSLRQQVSQSVKDTVAKTLQSDESQARLQQVYDDAYQKAIEGGASKEDASTTAYNATQAEVRNIAQQTGKQAIQDAADQLASHAADIKAYVNSSDVQKIGDDAYQDAYNKAYKARIETQNNLNSQHGRSLSDSDRNIADEAGKEAGKEARTKAIQSAGDDYTDKLLKQAASKTTQTVGTELVEETTESGAKLAGNISTDALTKTGSTTAGETAEELAGKLGAKVSTTVAKEASEVGAKVLGEMAATGVKTGVEAATLSAKAASLFAEVAGGPVGLIELAVQVAVQAGSSAAQQADQSHQLDVLVANASKPVDLHAMATDQNGNAIMMMGLLQMFSTPTSSTSTTTPTP